MEENDDFYDSQTPSSRIKAQIVAKYFPQYARILLRYPQEEIRFADLFSGPGLYRDGNPSTPLLVARKVADDSLLVNVVHFWFNDKTYIHELEANMLERFSPNPFKFVPKYTSLVVGEDPKVRNFIVKDIPKEKNPHPTLLFFDPWGYKGIDTADLGKFMHGWGNEIFLFVNIKRINAAVENKIFDDLMKSLFPKFINKLRKDRRYGATVYERLNLIMANLEAEFKHAIGDNIFATPFKFQESDSKATSHYLLHITKHPKGFELIKSVYHQFDNIGAALDRDGSYTFDEKRMGTSPNSMLAFDDPNIAALSEMLLKQYKGQRLTALSLFNEHHPKTKFAGIVYRDALRKLEEKGEIVATYTEDGVDHRALLLIESCWLEFK